MRVAGVELPKAKRVDIALTYIFGIGRSGALKILGAAKVAADKKTDDVTDEEQVRIRQVIDQEFKVEGDLRRDIQQSIKRLMDLGCYRGLRHRRGSAGAGTAHAYQCPHPQGTAQDRRGQEASSVQGINTIRDRAERGTVERWMSEALEQII